MGVHYFFTTVEHMMLAGVSDRELVLELVSRLGLKESSDPNLVAHNEFVADNKSVEIGSGKGVPDHSCLFFFDPVTGKIRHHELWTN